MHKPSPSFPKTPSPTSESAPKCGTDKRKRQREIRPRAAPSPSPPYTHNVSTKQKTAERKPSKNEPQLKPKSHLPQEWLTKSPVLCSQHKNLLVRAAAICDRKNETRVGWARRLRHASGLCVADFDA